MTERRQDTRSGSVGPRDSGSGSTRPTTRRAWIIAALMAVALGAAARTAPMFLTVVAETLPNRLGDREYWQLVEALSEPNGSFRSDNLLSNELQFQHVIPELTRIAQPGRVYLGVGPEQNFTYIAALRPAMVFIIDIRRGNLDLQLLYKALFELSADRAQFVSLLFSKPRPAGLGARSSAAEIFTAYASVASSERLYGENLSSIRNQLLTRHGFDLSDDDLRGIEYVYHAFAAFGPDIKYSPIGLGAGTIQPTYAALMAATDQWGQARAFLSTEDAFAFLKSLQSRNLIVPVVGDFAGAKAVRAVGAYLKQKGAVVSAFYLSNVEEYLRQNGVWLDFCANVSELPRDGTSTFIRSTRSGSGDPTEALKSEIGAMTAISNCR
ncbi:MAG: hypothetical protein ABI868_23820 [Acidobacteriota bacterium]